MAEDKNPQGDDHIEELLSQLQGIFGKLSHSDEEESQEKVDLPPPPAPVKPPVAPPAREVPKSEAPSDTLPLVPFYTPGTPAPVIPSTPAKIPPPAAAEPASPPEPKMPEANPAEIPLLPMEAGTDKAMVSCVIYYPPNREAEAKTLASRAETMTPRFTKVAFQIKVAASVPYDPKGEVAAMLTSQIKEGIRAVFLIVDRPMDDGIRKAVTNLLEPRGIYVQEVQTASVEKKALYTDLLLGMVFFFDSIKATGDKNG